MMSTTSLATWIVLLPALSAVAVAVFGLRGLRDRSHWLVILGIGVDVNLNPGDFPAELRKLATSLKAELGKPVLRPELAVAILRELDHDYARITSGHFTDVADEWEAHCITIGHNIVIRTGERQVRGRAEALGEDGTLLLRTDYGHLERIVGGDLTLDK